jgi:hypothetical protein
VKNSGSKTIARVIKMKKTMKISRKTLLPGIATCKITETVDSRDIHGNKETRGITKKNGCKTLLLGKKS